MITAAETGATTNQSEAMSGFVANKALRPSTELNQLFDNLSCASKSGMKLRPASNKLIDIATPNVRPDLSANGSGVRGRGRFCGGGPGDLGDGRLGSVNRGVNTGVAGVNGMISAEFCADKTLTALLNYVRREL